MIKIFGQTDRDFSSNGDIVVHPLKAKIHKEDNDEYYLDLETSLDYVDWILEGHIVIANTPTGEQAFRIYDIRKTMHKIIVRARHVFYDAVNYLIEDSYVVDKNCDEALKHLNAATDNTSPFSVSSNVSTIDSFRCVRKSLYEAVQIVLERWGGHLVRDNFSFAIRNTIGADNGVVVRYKKNLKDITSTENWSDVVTKLLPVGKDGLLLNGKINGEEYHYDPTIDIYVYSQIQYPIPYTKTVSFTQDINEEDYPTPADYQAALLADLREQAEAYVEEHSEPLVNYTLKANLEKITDVGDVVHVIDERLNMNFVTWVIAYDYDCLLKRYTSVEFGDFNPKLSNLIPNIVAETAKNTEKQLESVYVDLNTEIIAETGAIKRTMSNGTVIYDGESVLVVNALPKETATRAMIIDADGVSFSSAGISGTFNLAWDLYNVLKRGGASDKYGTLELYDNSDSLIAKADRTGLKIHGYDMFAHDGDTLSMTGTLETGVVCSGVLTDSARRITFAIPLPKFISDLDYLVTDLKINGWNVDGGYLFSNQYETNGHDVFNDNTLLAVAHLTTPNELVITISKSAGFNGTDNTPVSILINSFSVYVSEN